jgi:hypothetical protein
MSVFVLFVPLGTLCNRITAILKKPMFLMYTILILIIIGR